MSKRSEDTKQKIVEKIAETGLNKPGFTAGGISERTFYTWRSEDPQFSQAVADAHKRYRDSLNEQNKSQLKRRLHEYLFEGVTERYRKTEHYWDADGALTGSKTTEMIVNKPTPNWVFDKLTPKEAVSEVDALATLIESEMLPQSVIEVAYKGVEALKNNVKDELTGENHEKR
jgi:hypothetical protein